MEPRAILVLTNEGNHLGKVGITTRLITSEMTKREIIAMLSILGDFGLDGPTWKWWIREVF